MTTVPFFDYPSVYNAHREEYLQIMDDVCSRGAFIMQQDLTAFEQELADYLGVPHAIGVADGTMALIIALKLAGVGAGDEVIVPSHTFAATVSAVHHVGAEPVLCDCLADSMIDVDSARSVLSERSKAIMPVQLNGRTCDMDAVTDFADQHGLKIVEDSCQALGARFRDRPAGSFGTAGTFSFYPAKTLGCFGDGGAVILADDDLAQIARELRDHGRGGPEGKVLRFGLNARLDNLQAAILRAKLRRYDENIARRRELAGLYDERLREINALGLPPAPGSDPLRFDIFQNYEIRAEHRDDLRQSLHEQGIGTLIPWGGHMLHHFDALALRGDAPYAEAHSKCNLMLPMHERLNDDDVHRVCDGIVGFYRNAGQAAQ